MSLLSVGSGSWRTWVNSVPQLVKRMEGLTESHPDLARLETVGASVEGRSQHLLSLGNPDAEHTVFISGGVHGGEILTPHVIIETMEQLARESRTNTETAHLLRTVQFKSMPLVNVDGLDRSITRGINQRTNAAPLHDPTSLRWPHGVDLNRNGATGWVTANANLACRHGHHGTQPLDQPETRALYDLIDAEAESGKLKAAFDMHSFLPAALWEGGSDIGRQFASQIASITKYGAQASDAFYPAPGTVLSHYASKGIPALTLEMGERHKPDVDEALATFEKVRESIRYAGLIADDPANKLLAPIIKPGSLQYDANSGAIQLRGIYPVNMMFEGNSHAASIVRNPGDPLDSGVQLLARADDAVIDYAGHVPEQLIQRAGPGDARMGVFLAQRNHLGGAGPTRFVELAA